MAPCEAAQPNVVVTGGYLHIVARRDAATGKWTSAQDDDQGAAELSVWADGGADTDTFGAGSLAGVLDAGRQHR